MILTPTSVIQMRDLVDDVLQAGGWPRFRPATPGRAMRVGFELSCVTAGSTQDTAGAIRLRHFPYDADASSAAHAYWRTLLASAACQQLFITAEVTTRRQGGLTIWITARRTGRHQRETA